MIHIEKVELKDKELLFNINQKYLYEMTLYYNDPMDENGNYHYGYFDEYFTLDNRIPYFIYNDNDLVGFVFINNYSYINEHVDYVIGQMTIFPAYRQKGYAHNTIKLLFDLYKGAWEIKYNEKNIKAKNFWEKETLIFNPRKIIINEYETLLKFHN